MSFLLDTNICSDVLRGRPPASTKVLQYSGRLSISVVTLGELYTWALRLSANPKRIQQLADLRVAMTLLDVDHDVAYTFGRLRATLLDLGQPVPATDLLIAATAITHDLTLVTGNIRDFASVPGLRITDWK